MLSKLTYLNITSQLLKLTMDILFELKPLNNASQIRELIINILCELKSAIIMHDN